MVRPLAQRAEAVSDRAVCRPRRRVRPDDGDRVVGGQALAGKGRSRFSLRPALLGRLRCARPRHERRSEDDGHHRARPRLLRAPERGLHAAADLGDRQCRAGYGCRDLRRRLAHHPYPWYQDREDRRSAGIRRSDGLCVDPLDDRPLRLPRLHDSRDLWLRDGLGRDARPACRALGGCREHPGRLDLHDPDGGARGGFHGGSLEASRRDAHSSSRSPCSSPSAPSPHAVGRPGDSWGRRLSRAPRSRTRAGHTPAGLDAVQPGCSEVPPIASS